MKSRVQRWDLVVGACASLIAVAGLLLSVSLGNNVSLGFGNFHRDIQELLAVLAAMFLILVAIKAGLRYRTGANVSATGLSAVCATGHAAAEGELDHTVWSLFPTDDTRGQTRCGIASEAPVIRNPSVTP